MNAPAFDADMVTDQKRLARAEHYLQARTHLRKRDEIHNAKWRVLILAGGAPAGEIRTIRELMPRAHITATDIDERCLERAIDAGADEVIHCDLSEPCTDVFNPGLRPPKALTETARFDIAHIDLCAGANATSRLIAAMTGHAISAAGVFIFAFSYGRDVLESFPEAPELEKSLGTAARRLAYLFPKSRLANDLRSVILYQGAQMPMCSALFVREKRTVPVSVLKLEAGDFELAVTLPDPGLLYDCPQDRIEALRRKHAAIKAHYTLRTKSQRV